MQGIALYGQFLHNNKKPILLRWAQLVTYFFLESVASGQAKAAGCELIAIRRMGDSECRPPVKRKVNGGIVQFVIQSTYRSQENIGATGIKTEHRAHTCIPL